MRTKYLLCLFCTTFLFSISALGQNLPKFNFSNAIDLFTDAGTTYNDEYVKDTLHTKNYFFFVVEDEYGSKYLNRYNGTEVSTFLEKSFDITLLTNISKGMLFLVQYKKGGPTDIAILKNDGSISILIENADTLPGSGNRNKITSFGERAVFIYRENGEERLFTTDGTAGGTKLIESIPVIYAIAGLEAITDDHVLVITSTGEMYRSDGTESGSFQVLAENFSRRPSRFITSNKLIYFIYNNPDPELWVSDGTVNGTKVLTDSSQPAYNFSSIQQVAAYNSGIYFSVQKDNTGVELWKSDGTVIGTSLVRDINPGPGSGIRSSLHTIGELVFFKGGETDNRNNIWVSDGTVDGTIEIAEVDQVPNFNELWNFKKIIQLENKKVIFAIQSLTFPGYSIWSYSPGDNSATMIHNDIAGNPIQFLPTKNGIVYINRNNTSLDFSDGTLNGSRVIKDFINLGFNLIGDLDSTVYFIFYNADGLLEYWSTEGEINNTRKLSSNFENIDNRFTLPFLTFKSKPYLFLENQIIGEHLSQIDGDSIKVVYDLFNYTGNSNIGHPEQALGLIFFLHDRTLWRSDGQSNDIQPILSGIKSYTILGTINKIVLIANLDNQDLYFYNTKNQQISKLNNISAPRNLSSPNKSAIFKNKLWFVATKSNDNVEQIYSTDGTSQNTILEYGEADSPYPRFSVSPRGIFSTNNHLYFFGRDSIHFVEAWSSDGTKAGTDIIVDYTNRNTPYNGKIIDDELYFIRNISTDNYSLLKSDGTKGRIDTIKENLFSAAEVHSWHDNLLIWADTNFIKVNKNTLESTVLIRNDKSFRIDNFNTIDSSLFLFSTNLDNLNSPNIWISDGSKIGTREILEVNNNSFRIQVVPFQNGFLSYKSSYDPSTDTLFYIDSNQMVSTEMLTDIIIDDIENIGILNNQLYIYGSSLRYGKEIHLFNLNKRYQFDVNVYHDLNENNQQDSNERGLANFQSIADQGSSVQYSYTDTSGIAYFNLNNRDLTQLTISDQNCWILISDSTSYTIDPDSLPGYPLNFGFRQINGAQNADVFINHAPTRCNTTVTYWINVFNTGCQAFNGELKIELPANVSLVDYDRDPNEVNGQIITIKISDLPISRDLQFPISLMMPDENSTGDQILVKANISGVDDNGNPLVYGFKESTSILRCAYDPNDKLVTPSREEPSNSNYTTFDEQLNYTIRFQNTGNDTAIDVRIVDQLSPLLDWSTFEPISASHDYRTTRFDDGRVEFLFENIMLPDSNVNEKASHGYVNFSIMALDSLEDLTTIFNQAEIYFDLNQPIITNNINSTMVESLDYDEDGYFVWEDCDDYNDQVNPGQTEIPGNGIDDDCDGEGGTVSTVDLVLPDIKAYPNPMTDHLMVEIDQPGMYVLNIYDVNGKLVLSRNINEQRSRLSTQELTLGIYFATIESTNQEIIGRVKLVKLRLF